jgi:hypothetical protein
VFIINITFKEKERKSQGHGPANVYIFTPNQPTDLHRDAKNSSHVNLTGSVKILIAKSLISIGDFTIDGYAVSPDS